MPGDNQLPDASRDFGLDQHSEGGPPRGRKRSLRTLTMSEDERTARRQRRRLFHDRFGSSNEPDQHTELKYGETQLASSNTTQPTTGQAAGNTGNPASVSTSAAAATGGIQGRKPWETIVIGDLGENLSFIEEKDREIEQQRYIIRYHEEHSPYQVEHHQKILEKLIQERSEMADDEENNMPEDQREERNRIGERLDLLNWALETCQCEAEEINIRAAIQGYQSGEIPYSNNFTLIYGGHIVDVCPTYRSFCEDRQERLDRYFEKFGPGWLWQEPPLSGRGFEALANKGLCLDRTSSHRDYFIGHYAVNMRFSVDKRRVMREGPAPRRTNMGNVNPPPDTEVSCWFKTLFDSGATFPNLPLQDVRRLSIDLRQYAAQGVTRIRTVSEIKERRFFEMQVSVCSEDGSTIVGGGDQAVWPDEPRTIGGFYPVWVNEDKKERIDYKDRLSGMVPFDSCYMSSAPTMYEFWLGEDRRDVLGARRMPAHLRYATDKVVGLEYPEHFERMREEAGTPDQVIFVHRLDEGSQLTFSDADWPGVRGKSELAILERKFDESSQRVTTKAKDNTILEPRKGKHWEEQKDIPVWRNEFLGPGDLTDSRYTKLGGRPANSKGDGEAGLTSNRRRKSRRERKRT